MSKNRNVLSSGLRHCTLYTYTCYTQTSTIFPPSTVENVLLVRTKTFWFFPTIFSFPRAPSIKLDFYTQPTAISRTVGQPEWNSAYIVPGEWRREPYSLSSGGTSSETSGRKCDLREIPRNFCPGAIDKPLKIIRTDKITCGRKRAGRRVWVERRVPTRRTVLVVG